MNKYVNHSETNEVRFSNTQIEFQNFYESHRNICDEISGSKIIVFKHLKEQDEVVVRRENFIKGIKRLQAFVINYAHSFDEKSKENEVLSDVFNIEDDFIHDAEYEQFTKRTDSLNSGDNAKFNLKYYQYMFRCFEVIVKVSQYLQSSMMVGTKNVRSLLAWMDVTPFFRNLGEYREEISNIISNFVVSEIESYYKKVLAYHYTYRVFVDSKELNKIDEIIRVCNEYMINYEFLKFVEKVKNGTIRQDVVKKENVLLKKALYLMLKLTNQSLSDKNILPKIKKKVLIDKTGI